MVIELNDTELSILDFIFDIIPEYNKFNIDNLYSEKLRRKYEADGIPYAQVESKRDEFRKSHAFDRITEFLTQNKFAEICDSDKNAIILKDKGVILIAYDNFQSYLNSKKESAQSEIIERVPKVISNIAPYGEFTIAPPKATDYPVLHGQDDAFQQYTFTLSEKGKRIFLHGLFIEQEEVLSYLVNEGFLINRHDIKKGDELYRQFTDKGRKLKELGGTIQAYQNYEAQLALDIYNAQIDRKRESQRNKYQYWVNFSIAISTGVAAIFYFFGLFDFYKNHSLNWQHFAYFLSGFGLAILVWLIQRLLKKISN